MGDVFRTTMGALFGALMLWVSIDVVMPAPQVVEVRYVRPVFDISNPFERCLAAVESAELPGWMWECNEFRWQSRDPR